MTSARAALDLSELITVGAMMPRADHCLAVHEAFQPLFPEGGLVRGQVAGTSGSAAVSAAVAVAARAVETGSWMAVVGLSGLGVEAAGELGVPLQRVVAVDGGTSSLDWADRVSACADGFDVVVAAPPPTRSSTARSSMTTGSRAPTLDDRAHGLLRRVRQRLVARGSVLILVDVQPAGCDVSLKVAESRWIGIGAGHGTLLARAVTIESVARRQPRPRTQQVWLPDHTGAISVVQDAATSNRHRLVC